MVGGAHTTGLGDFLDDFLDDAALMGKTASLLIIEEILLYLTQGKFNGVFVVFMRGK